LKSGNLDLRDGRQNIAGPVPRRQSGPEIRSLAFLVAASSLFAAPAEPVVRKDIPFLGEERSEKLDAYLPAESFERPLPAVVFIHGGGWTGGSKSEAVATGICRTLAENGYAAFSIDYKLNTVTKGEDGKSRITKVVWPENLHDCKSAIRYVRRHAREFGIDPDRIAVMGASADAHLALLVAATKDSAQWNVGGLDPETSNEVAAVVEFYGRHDVSRDRRQHFAGATPEETEINVTAASPVTHLTPSMPPVLAIQGEADKIVPVTYGRELAERLKTLGVPHEYVEIPGAGHSFGLKLPQKDLTPIVLDFLGRHLAKKDPAKAD
jgi:acetyl esterase/lipase